ncbi:MAG: SRPBCC family protein [Actinomycetota bacterium]|nr:SRPBCC family protein [Actinomycetota bacterium]
MADPMAFERSIHINATPEVVWELITDVNRHPEFAGEQSITKKIHFEGRLEVGARWTADEKIGPMKFTAASEITILREPEEFGWKSFPPAKDEDHQAEVHWTYRVAPEESGVRLTLDMSGTAPKKGLRMIKFQRFLVGAPKKNPRDMMTTLENIKLAAEREQASMARA